MIELELLGANGDTVVMTDGKGERYTIVVDDALRAAVRRARPAALSRAMQPPAPGSTVRPRDLQAYMRAGASAEEVATTTGMDIEHVRRFEGPVLAEREWAVRQAQACRIGWEKDSPVLGELVVDRLATRGVEPSSLQWDALREARDPWQVTLAFVQGAEAKLARWELDLTARSVSALDEEAHWLTEAASAHRPAVFDQDSTAPGASSAPSVAGEPPAAAPVPPVVNDVPAATAADGTEEPRQQALASGASGAPVQESSTDVLLADLASSRGRRVEVKPPLEDFADEEEAAPPAPSPAPVPRGPAQVVSMSERRRNAVASRSAGVRRRASAPSAPSPSYAGMSPEAAASIHNAPTMPTARVEELLDQQTAPAPPPEAPAPKPRRRSRRSVPSWDEIVFGAKPE